MKKLGNALFIIGMTGYILGMSGYEGQPVICGIEALAGILIAYVGYRTGGIKKDIEIN